MLIRASHHPPVRTEPEKFGVEVPGYTGPEDGLSSRKYDAVLQPLNRLLIAGCFRLEVEGQENFPHQGRHVYCPNHPSYFDPPLIASLSERDMRYIANVNVFDGVRGHFMTWGGAFPVHREAARVKTLRHAVDVLREGKGLCIFPEHNVVADPERIPDQVNPLKKGAAYFALRGQAESIVPIAIDYREFCARPGPSRLGLAAAAALAVGGVVAGACGGPVARIAVATLSGAVAGAYGVGKLCYDAVPNPGPYDPFPKYFATLKGGAAGSVLAGAAAGFSTALGEGGLACSLSGLAGALGAYALVKAWQERPVARVLIGEPLVVAPYRQDGCNRKAVVRLTEDLHAALGRTTEQLTGKPYACEGPRISS
ncbi:MAG: hypothetical protein AMXMBFR33_44860 [Candidatus Xenobia bacterium]